MTKYLRSFRFWLGAYVGAAILTFGHAASHNVCRFNNEPGLCKTDGAMSGMMAGMFWPLYWSWQIQS